MINFDEYTNENKKYIIQSSHTFQIIHSGSRSGKTDAL